jgi:hypothetical protein
MPEEIDGVIHITQEEVLAFRQDVLDKHGLTEEDLAPADCGCCPARPDISTSVFDEYRIWGWLLGE